MAKIVIAGRADCPYFSKIEILADKLEKNLPDFNLHKIVKTPREWEDWLSNECGKRGWKHEGSPMVWRELIDRGGKGVLIGDANDFQEYCQSYYGEKSTFTSDDMLRIAAENMQTKDEIDEEERMFRAQSKPTHICITSAASSICYQMINEIGRGVVLGNKMEVALHLYDTSENEEALHGVKMETMDLAHPLIRDISIAKDLKEAFSNCSAIVLLDELLKEEEESKEDWLKRNRDLFVKYAETIDQVAKKDVKIVIAGNGPCNFNALMMIKTVQNIPHQNIVASPRAIENRAKALVAEKLSVNTASVVDVIVWGNPNSESYIDLSRSRVHNYDGAIWGPPYYSRPVPEMVHDDKWLTSSEFLEQLKQRKESEETQMTHKADKLTASAINSVLAHWWNGSPENQIFSLGVLSPGNFYGIPEDIVSSLPVTFHPEGHWIIKEDIELNDEGKERLKQVVADLEAEKAVIYPPPKAPTPEPETQTSGEESDKKEEEGKEAKEEATDEEHPTLEKIVEVEEAEEKAAQETEKPTEEVTEEAKEEPKE